MNCDRCENEATIHITEIRRGLSYDRHLCEKCAEMLLPFEGTDDAKYLAFLPPKHSIASTDEEPEPTPEELKMTRIDRQVLVVDLRTGAFEPVGLHRGNSSLPVWSPDSKFLAMCHSTERYQSLVLVQPGKTWLRRFLHTTFDEPAGWSRDSRTVAFSHPEEEGAVVMTAEVATGRTHRLSAPPLVSESRPVWSPRDERIALASLLVERGDTEASWCSVFTATLEPEKRRRLVTVRGSLVMDLGWSADARFVAVLTAPFSREVEAGYFPEMGDSTLHVVRSDSEDASDTAVSGNYVGFSWVPRAAGVAERPMLLVNAVAADGVGASIVLIDPETREVHPIAEQAVLPNVEGRADYLSPDGKTLVARRRADDSRIVLIDLRTRATEEIEGRGEVIGLSWPPARDEFAALTRSDAGASLEWLTPEGARREVVSFSRARFFDVPSMALSPDGNFAALEAHTARKD